MFSPESLISGARRIVQTGFLLTAVGCQEQRLIVPEVLMSVIPEPVFGCVLPESPIIDWKPWEKNKPLTFFLPDRRTDISFIRNNLLPGVFVRIEKRQPPDWHKEPIKQGFLNPGTEYFLDVEGLTIALYGCDDQGENIYWADLSE